MNLRNRPGIACMALLCIAIGFGLGWVIKPSKSGSEASALRSTSVLRGSPSGAMPGESPNAANAPAKPGLIYAEAGSESLPLAKQLSQSFAIRDPHQRFANFASIVAALSTSAEFESVARAIKAADRQGLQFAREWEHLLEQWGRRLGSSAMEVVISQFADPKEPAWVKKRILCGWGESDPVAATAWLNAHTDTPDWDGQLYELLTGIGRHSLETGTRAAIDSLPPGKSWAKDQTMRNLAEIAVREGGIQRLQSWFQSLPTDQEDNSIRAAALPAVYSKMKHADADIARRFAEENSAR